MQQRVVNAAKTLCLIAAAIVPVAMARGDAPNTLGSATWATGAAFQQRLAQPVDILWSNTPLRGAIEGLSQAQRVAILIDRRVDPDQKLTLSLKRVPMESALRTIAESCGLGLSRLGAVVYLGPPSTAARLRPIATAFEQTIRQMPAAVQRKYLQSKALVWNDLSTPRDLLDQLGQQSDVEIAGLERVPHDLWAAADLPPVSLIDRLTLIAAEFDLTFQVAADGARLELVPVPADLPGATENHEGLSTPNRSPGRTAAEPPASLETIRIQRMSVQAEPLGPVLRQLADRLGLELRIDEKAIAEAGISLDQRVSVKVQIATVDELLRQLLKSTGLTFHRRQKVVEIVPAE